MKNHNEIQEENKNLVSHVVNEIWNKGKFDMIENLVSDDFVIHTARPEEDLKGPEQVKQFYTHLHISIPRYKIYY